MFYDAGGSGGNDGNTNYTITLVPAVAGEMVCLDFSMFNTYYDGTSGTSIVGDSVCIFDGSTSLDSLKITTLIGNYGSKWIQNGSAPSSVGIGADIVGMPAVKTPGVFCSTNPNGSLTISFYNGSPNQAPGWVAKVVTYKPLGSTNTSVNINASSTTVCAGTPVALIASGNNITVPINNDFNNNSVGAGWQSTTSVTFQTNACGYKSLDGSVYLWMANAVCPRSLTSNPIDVSFGGNISFEYRQASVNGDASPCESPDINSFENIPEAVYLQYSINSGTTWNNLKVMFPSDDKGGINDNYNGIGYETKLWKKIIVPIQDNAKSSITQFRWIMPLCTSAMTDNWGLDNVVINASGGANVTITDLNTNNVIASGVSPVSVNLNPMITTTYLATSIVGSTTNTSQVTVNVNPLPIVSISEDLLIPNVSASLIASGALTYQWSNGESINYLTINPTISETYTVTGTDINGCVSVASYIITSPNNVKNKQINTFKIYPNPANTEITLETINSKESIVAICNIEGQKIIEQQFIIPKKTIDISSLANGIYFIKVVGYAGVEVKKLIVKR